MRTTLASLGLVLALLGGAACGGPAKPSATTPPPPPPPAAPSPCVAMAAHVADALRATAASEGDTAAGERLAPVLERVMNERCQADAWAEATVACFTTADAPGMDACVNQLAPAQQETLDQALEAAMAAAQDEDAAAGGAAEESDDKEGGTGARHAPPPPDDPCGGGE